ncbi:hypothetical protein D9M71_824610 [compost metagenome]
MELVGDRAVADDGSGLVQFPDLAEPGLVGSVRPLGDAHQFKPDVFQVVQALELPECLGGELGLAADEFELLGGAV